MALEHKEIKKQSEDKNEKKHFIKELKDYLDLRFEFRKNVLTMEVEIRALKSDKFILLEEDMLNSIWIDLQMDGYKCSDGLLLKILNSKLTPSYNPLQRYFDELPPYDGIDYIKQLADTITIKDIEVDGIHLAELWEEYLKKWLVASASTILGRGVNQTCLILVGGQGAGKTTWLNKLCPKEMKNFLACSHINPSLTDQNTANFLAEKWFLNVDDQLETIFGKDFNSMKAIITAPFITNRKTWHKMTKTRPRICSFMGSVNNPQFLTDIENRRYLVFSTAEIDFKHNVDMNKVWSQAAHLVKEKYQYWFAQEDMKKLNKVNEIYRHIPPEEEWLIKLYEPCQENHPKVSFVMPSEILARINAYSGLRLSIKKLARAMEKLGYGDPVSKRLNNRGPRKVYPVIKCSESDEDRVQAEMKDSN